MIQALLNIPSGDHSWNLWSFDHRAHHDLIRAAILAKGGPDLTDWQLDPIPQNDLVSWQQRHQQEHVDMDAYLGFQSNDLLDVNLKDQNQLESWVYLNWQEHNDAALALGI